MTKPEVSKETLDELFGTGNPESMETFEQDDNLPVEDELNYLDDRITQLAGVTLVLTLILGIDIAIRILTGRKGNGGEGQ